MQGRNPDHASHCLFGIVEHVGQGAGETDAVPFIQHMGFVIEPDNPDGLAFFMKLLSVDEDMWRKMCVESQAFAERADSARFAEAVEALITPRKR